ncbi:MAG: hypothetical protein WCT12_32035, partial [Verrucomicrobiota bacterium]
ARAAALACPAQHILLDLELRGANIDQQAVLNARRTQVAVLVIAVNRKPRLARSGWRSSPGGGLPKTSSG